MTATVLIYAHPSTPPHEEYGFLYLADNVTVHLPTKHEDAAAWCRQLAELLLTMATGYDDAGREAREGLERLYEEVGERRHDADEIAPDGVCWDCHNGDHSGHKHYVGGRCYGCTCPPRDT